jgi:ankyrin repeat protein
MIRLVIPAFILCCSLGYAQQDHEDRLSAAIASGNFWRVHQELKVMRENRDSESTIPTLAMALNSKFRWLMFHFLVWEGVDVNARDEHGWTALMEASAQCDVKYVRKMLELGASVDGRTTDGRTPLMVIGDDRTEEVLQIAQALLEAGVRLDAVASDGLTAISHARRLKRRDLEYMLIARRNENPRE